MTHYRRLRGCVCWRKKDRALGVSAGLKVAIDVVRAIPKPNNPDSDGDGILDGAEYFGWSSDTDHSDNPPGPNNIPNYVWDDLESKALIVSNPNHYITDPANEDTDGDGMDDKYEIECGDAFDGWQNPFIQNNRYAVLMCWSYTDIGIFWLNMEAIYNMLRENGYKDENIYVLAPRSDVPSHNSVCVQGYNGSIDITYHPEVEYPCSINQISQIFDELWAKVTENDFVFIYGTGHGTYCAIQNGVIKEKESFEHSLLRLQQSADELEDELFTDDDFAENINKIEHYARMIIMLECCHSGGFIDDLSGQNRIIITSAPYNQRSSGGSTQMTSPMTGHFVVAMNGNGDADRYGEENGYVSIGEAYNYWFEKNNDYDWTMYDDNGEPLDRNDLIDDVHWTGRTEHVGEEESWYYHDTVYDRDLFYFDKRYEDKYGENLLGDNHIDGPGMHLPTKDPISGVYLWQFDSGTYCGYEINGWREGYLGSTTYL